MPADSPTPTVFFLTGSSRGLRPAIPAAVLAPAPVLPLALDVPAPAAAEAAIAAGRERFGRIDVVVNNAGYANLAAVEDVDPDHFRAQVDTNLFGVVNVTKAALPVLREQRGGHILQG